MPLLQRPIGNGARRAGSLAGKARWGAWAQVWVLFLLLAAPVVARAQPAQSPPPAHTKRTPRDQGPSYQATFSRLSKAWRASDRKALSGLVHPDGLKVVSGRAGERAVTYSPSQAFYYFRNLFQNVRTNDFVLDRVQKNPGGDRVHALATWELAGPRGGRTTRMVLVLTRRQGRWYLSEITTIK